MTSSSTQEVGEDDESLESTATNHSLPNHNHDATIEQNAYGAYKSIPRDISSFAATRVEKLETIEQGNMTHVTEYHFHGDVNVYGGISSVDITGNNIRGNRGSVLSDIDIRTRQKSTHHVQKSVHEKHEGLSQSFTSPSSLSTTDIDVTPLIKTANHLQRRSAVRNRRKQTRVSQIHVLEDHSFHDGSDSRFRHAGVALTDRGGTSHGPATRGIEEEDRTEPQRSLETLPVWQRYRALAVNHATDGRLETQMSDIPDDAHCDVSFQTDCSTAQPEEPDSSLSSFSGSSSHPFLRVPSPRSSKHDHHSHGLSHSPSRSPRAYSPSQLSAVYRTSSPSFQVDVFPTHGPPPFVTGANYPSYDEVNQPISGHTEPGYYPQFPTPAVSARVMTFPTPTFVSASRNTVPSAILTRHNSPLPFPKSPNNELTLPASNNNHQKLKFPEQTTHDFPMTVNPSIAPRFDLPFPEIHQEPDHDSVLVPNTAWHEQANSSSAWYGDAKRRTFEHQSNIRWDLFMGEGRGLR